MRSEYEIQRAHDLFVGILIGECRAQPEDLETRRLMHAATDVLCWVLNHDHNPNFAKNLAEIESRAANHGFLLLPAKHS